MKKITKTIAPYLATAVISGASLFGGLKAVLPTYNQVPSEVQEKRISKESDLGLYSLAFGIAAASMYESSRRKKSVENKI